MGADGRRQRWADKTVQPGSKLLLLCRGPAREQVEEPESSLLMPAGMGTRSLGLPRQP